MYRITEILPTSSGDRLLLRLLSSDGEAVTVNISCKTYGEMGLKKGELSDETASSLMNAAEHEKAVIKGLSILGYGMNSQRRLCQKLREKGFSSKVRLFAPRDTATTLCMSPTRCCPRWISFPYACVL